MTQILTTTDSSTKKSDFKQYKMHVYIHENDDPDSPVIFDGYPSAAQKIFKCSSYQIRYAASSLNHLLLDKYYIEGVNEPTNNGRPKKDEFGMTINKTSSRFESKLKMIKKHLDIYGNTFTNRDPSKYIAALKERFGYDVDVEYRPRRVIHAANSTGIAEIYDPIYILTLVSKPEEK